MDTFVSQNAAERVDSVVFCKQNNKNALKRKIKIHFFLSDEKRNETNKQKCNIHIRSVEGDESTRQRNCMCVCFCFKQQEYPFFFSLFRFLLFFSLLLMTTKRNGTRCKEKTKMTFSFGFFSVVIITFILWIWFQLSAKSHLLLHFICCQKKTKMSNTIWFSAWAIHLTVAVNCGNENCFPRNNKRNVVSIKPSELHRIERHYHYTFVWVHIGHFVH